MLVICFKIQMTDFHCLISAEIGDYDETLDREHLKANKYLPNQELSLEKILDFHREHT
jgi:FERM/RhoGEF/pleckstrin domain protein 2